MEKYKSVTSYKKVFKEAKEISNEDIKKQLRLSAQEIQESVDFHLEALNENLQKTKDSKLKQLQSKFIKALNKLTEEISSINDEL